MSTCISRAGEYGEHDTEPGNYICDRCGVLDEDGIFAGLEALRNEVATLRIAEAREKSMRAISEAELARVNALLKARTDALNRTVKRAETAEAKVARVEALLEKDDSTFREWVRIGRQPFVTAVDPKSVRTALDGEQP